MALNQQYWEMDIEVSPINPGKIEFCISQLTLLGMGLYPLPIICGDKFVKENFKNLEPLYRDPHFIHPSQDIFKPSLCD